MTGWLTVLVVPGVVRTGCLMVIQPTGGEVLGRLEVCPISSMLVEPLVNFVNPDMKLLRVLAYMDWLVTVVRLVMTVVGGALVASSVMVAVLKAAYQYIRGEDASRGVPKRRYPTSSLALVRQ
ncbi:MAG: hypothetical protein EBZ78_09540 [Verrucomicrobia bacterium]|nr:hypothetical protein [Verrucomicrobiota bacterium]